MMNVYMHDEHDGDIRFRSRAATAKIWSFLLRRARLRATDARRRETTPSPSR